MPALLLIMGAALLIGLGGLVVLLLVLSSHQYDDLDGAAQRILIDDPDEKIS